MFNIDAIGYTGALKNPPPIPINDNMDKNSFIEKYQFSPGLSMSFEGVKRSNKMDLPMLIEHNASEKIGTVTGLTLNYSNDGETADVKINATLTEEGKKAWFSGYKYISASVRIIGNPGKLRTGDYFTEFSLCKRPKLKGCNTIGISYSENNNYYDILCSGLETNINNNNNKKMSENTTTVTSETTQDTPPQQNTTPPQQETKNVEVQNMFGALDVDKLSIEKLKEIAKDHISTRAHKIEKNKHKLKEIMTPFVKNNEDITMAINVLGSEHSLNIIKQALYGLHNSSIESKIKEEKWNNEKLDLNKQIEEFKKKEEEWKKSINYNNNWQNRYVDSVEVKNSYGNNDNNNTTSEKVKRSVFEIIRMGKIPSESQTKNLFSTYSNKY